MINPQKSGFFGFSAGFGVSHLIFVREVWSWGGGEHIYIYVAETFRVYFTAGSSFSSSAIIIIILILL